MASYPEHRIPVTWDALLEDAPDLNDLATSLLKQVRWELRKPTMTAHQLIWSLVWREKPILRDLTQPHDKRTEARVDAVQWVALVASCEGVEVMADARLPYPPDPVCDAILDQEAALG